LAKLSNGTIIPHGKRPHERTAGKAFVRRSQLQIREGFAAAFTEQSEAGPRFDKAAIEIAILRPGIEKKAQLAAEYAEVKTDAPENLTCLGFTSLG
jgi:hypothetical protein